METWHAIHHDRQLRAPVRALLRAACVCCLCGLATTACVSTAHLAPRPLTGEYPALVVDLMVESAKRSEKRTPAEPGVAAVAVWRSGADGGAEAPGGLGSTTPD